MVLFPTHCVPPIAPASAIERPYLQAVAAQLHEANVGLVHAPAGFGKTTAMLHWMELLRRSGAATSWLTIDKTMNGTTPPIECFLQSLREAMPDQPPPADPFAADSADQAAAQLSARIMRLNKPFYIFLDDFEHATPAIRAFTEALIRVAPPQLHVVIASRSMPHLGLSRLMASGRVVEVTRAMLAFTPDDLARLCQQQRPASVDAATQVKIFELTSGWPAGIGLILAQIRQNAALSATGIGPWCTKSFAAFFDDAVLRDLDEDAKKFVLCTAVLDEFDVPVCASVMQRDDARNRLAEIQSAGLFLEELDQVPVKYRYMPLFRAFLKRRLAESFPDLEALLCRRASEYFGRLGEVERSLDYAARADDPEFLANALERDGEQLSHIGGILKVVNYAESLPADMVNRLPRVLLVLAWLRIHNLEFQRARALLGQAKICIDHAGSNTAEENAELSLLFLHREMMLAVAEDKLLPLGERCETLLRCAGTEHSYITGTVYAQLMTARREQYEFHDLSRLEALCRAGFARSGTDFGAISLQTVIGPSLFAIGKVDEAIEALEDGLGIATRFTGERSSTAALPALALSEVLYERNELARAASLIGDYLRVARDFSFPDQLISGYLTGSRIQYAKGNLAGALGTLDIGIDISVEHDLKRLRLNMLAEKMRLLINANERGQLAEIATMAEFSGPSSAVVPRLNSTTRHETEALAWCRLALDDDRCHEALHVAKQWQRFCMKRGAVRALIRWNLLIAKGLMMEGEQNAAQRAMLNALHAAASGRFLRSFLDEGPMIRSMLQDRLGSAPPGLAEEDRFAQEVLAAFDAGSSPIAIASAAGETVALSGRLQPREVDILTLVAAGLRNREIGDRLGLTEGTVKWYMSQIYDKFGVRRRPLAVDRGRRFGLIA